MTEAPRLGSLSARQLATLWAILTAALVFRTLGLGWGLPPREARAEAPGVVSSYAFDEEHTLESLVRTDPRAFDFDPRFYRWGTLHLELTLAALEGAQAAGVFGRPWRESFRDPASPEFERVYVIGRLLSVTADLATVLLVFLLGMRLGGPAAGLWGAALSALSPGQMVQATQIRVDVTATLLLTLLCWLALARKPAWVLGLLAGLAVTAKYSVALAALAAVAPALYQRSARRREILQASAAALLGFLLGEPFVLTNGGEVVEQVGQLIRASRQTGLEGMPSKPWLMLQSLLDLARFSMGVPAAALGLVGLGLLLRRGQPLDRLAPLVCLAVLVSLLPQNWPLMRYSLPALPLLAAAAGLAIVTVRHGRQLGAVAVVVAAAISGSQAAFRVAPHPANLALSVARKAIPAGSTVSRIMPELPPLSESLYRPGPNPLLENLADDPPDWVITSGLPIIDYPEANLDLLAREYETVAVFRSRNPFPWATLGEVGAPQDWKYTHPEMAIYRRR